MRHCRDDAATLPEPEWYRMISVVARCEGASTHVHDLSRPHSKYTARETNAKLRQASSQKVAPVTCAYVQSDLGGGKYCSTCLFRDNVNSPIAIGRLDLDPAESADTVAEDEPSATPAVSAPPPDQPRPDPAGELKDAATKIEKFTDLGNAKRMVAKYRDQVRYCEAWGRWFIWDRRRWAEDRKLRVCDMAADLVRGMYALAKGIKDQDEREAFFAHLIKSESHRAITAMINLAKPDKTLAVLPDDLDADPWTLTVLNGTINLRTGKLGPHRQSDLISKMAPVTYDPDARCPNWDEFLSMVMNQRSRLVTFLQRAFGCCLTGVTSDKAMFILYGAGGDNGKSTMVDVIQCLLGDYAMRTPTDTFMRKKEGAIPNDVARLKGARFVWASENERGSRLSESLIKEMTGGDKLAARFMRGEFFEFYPEFKPWLATNHKPQIRGDKAIWNRLKLIPFDVSIPKDQQKPRHLVMAMFRSEMPGILNWAIKGCLDWHREGLGVPEEVVEATGEYEAEQDTFAMFLNEKCVCVPNARVASNALYRAYKQWAEEYGEAPMSHKMFASFLAERGFGKVRVSKGIVYEGVGVRAEDVYDKTASRPSGRERGAGMRDEDGEVI